MKAGNLKIKWYHDNLFYSNGSKHFTACVLSRIMDDQSEEVLRLGGAYCSKNDTFCKDTGRKLSLLRAMKKADIPKEERKVIWEVYRNSKPGGRW